MAKIDSWVTKVTRLKNSKVARFSYRAEAYANDEIEGVSSYDYAQDMNVPLATHTDFDASMLSIGARANLSSVPKNGLNHFFGRVSYNLNKVIDFLSDFLDDFISFTEIVKFTTSSTLATYQDGTTKRLLNTAASSITITLPAGETYLGSSTIALAPSAILTITKIGTVWLNFVDNAVTAAKLATARTINGVSFDGSADITVADSTKAPTSHASSATTYGAASEANYGHAKASTVAGSANGAASKGSTPTVFAQSNHVHPLQTSVSGNSGTATKLATAITINGVSFDGSTAITVADSTKAPIAHASSATTYGVSSEANYGHAKASTVVGSANGTASKGSTPTIFAQSNHVHPYEIETLRKSASFTLGTYADGKKLRIANTHATTTITVTLPSGITYAGAITSFTLKPYEKIEIELFGTEWDEVRNEGIGTITATGSTTADFGRLLCQGQALSRTTYARLFNRIGTAFGVGNGSTTFNLPDLREVALVGAGTNVLNASGIASHNALITGQFQDDQMQGHRHTGGMRVTQAMPYSIYAYGITGGASQPSLDVAAHATLNYNQPNTSSPILDSNGSPRTGNTTHGKQLGVNYQIKY